MPIDGTFRAQLCISLPPVCTEGTPIIPVPPGLSSQAHPDHGIQSDIYLICEYKISSESVSLV